MRIISYFNPISSQHHAIADSKQLSPAKRRFAWLAAIVVAPFTFGLGGVALFRTLVGRLAKEPPQEPLIQKVNKVFDYTKDKPDAFKRIFLNYPLFPDQVKLIQKIPLKSWKELDKYLNALYGNEESFPDLPRSLIQDFQEHLNPEERGQIVTLIEKVIAFKGEQYKRIQAQKGQKTGQMEQID